MKQLSLIFFCVVFALACRMENQGGMISDISYSHSNLSVIENCDKASSANSNEIEMWSGTSNESKVIGIFPGTTEFKTEGSKSGKGTTWVWTEAKVQNVAKRFGWVETERLYCQNGKSNSSNIASNNTNEQKIGYAPPNVDKVGLYKSPTYSFSNNEEITYLINEPISMEFEILEERGNWTKVKVIKTSAQPQMGATGWVFSMYVLSKLKYLTSPANNLNNVTVSRSESVEDRFPHRDGWRKCPAKGVTKMARIIPGKCKIEDSDGHIEDFGMFCWNLNDRFLTVCGINGF